MRPIPTLKISISGVRGVIGESLTPILLTRFAQAFGTYVGARTVVIGRDPPGDVLAAARDAAVHVPGYVEDVRPYLAAAAIYVCPIRDGGGTRLKVLDALAMAKPLVATGLAVEGLDLVEEEHYLRAETPVDTVRQIRRLERDPDLSRRLAWSGRRLVEQRYSWEVIGARLNQAYQLAKTGARLQPHA